MTPHAARTWLKNVAIAVGASGILFALAAIPALSWPGALFVDLAFWPLDGQPSVASPAAHLLSGIAGGLTVGFCAIIWMVADRLMLQEPALARSIIATGVGSWCLIDSLASVAAGAPMNAVFNVVMLAAFVWPLRQLITRTA